MGPRENTFKSLLAFRPGDLVALGVVLLAAIGLGLSLLFQAAGVQSVTVEIRRDGELVERFPLSQNRTVEIEGDYTNIVAAEDGAVWMESSTCPGSDCVHSGKISSSGRAIVCLPNRVEIRLVGGTPDEVDMVVG